MRRANVFTVRGVACISPAQGDEALQKIIDKAMKILEGVKQWQDG